MENEIQSADADWIFAIFFFFFDFFFVLRLLNVEKVMEILVSLPFQVQQSKSQEDASHNNANSNTKADHHQHAWQR